MKNIQVPNSEDGSRFDRCLRRLLGNINQPLLEKSLRLGLILLDKKKIKSSFKVKKGQIIFYSHDIKFENIDIKHDFDNHTNLYYRNLYNKILIKETDEYLAFNKPSGLAVQGGSSQKYHIDDMLRCLFNQKNTPKLIHRIDKDTSGLLLVAKNQQTAMKFSNYFKEKKIIKIYLAIVSPCPQKEKGVIDLPLYKSGLKGNQKMVVDYNRGKKAITEFKVLDKASSRIALIALYPKTGRTHQLRVHLEYMNFPIVGDNKYSGSSSVHLSDRNLLEHESIENLQLHAYSIRMPSNELIEAKVSDNFERNLNFLGLIIPKNIHNMFT